MCLYVYVIMTHCVSDDMNNVDIRINIVSIEYSTVHINHLLCTGMTSSGHQWIVLLISIMPN